MVISLEDTLASDEYDEFGLLHENASEWDIPFARPPVVTRRHFTLPSGQSISYLRWGEGEPELVLLHGLGQSAHTWDTVLLALGRPAIAVDLPGHGHSDWRADCDYGPWQNAEAVAALMEAVAPWAEVVVGISLGGATTIRLGAEYPGLCRRAIYVDTTPQLSDPARTFTTSELGGKSLFDPTIYTSFHEMADAAVALSPFRCEASIRRSVRHVSRRLDDGRWTWRCDPYLSGPGWSRSGYPGFKRAGSHSPGDFTPLWEDVSDTKVPGLLIRGELSPFVRDEDVEEMCHRHPSLDVVVIEGSWHTVQGDQPLALAACIREFAL
jgi:pimeloyl-ACP methyl ester carboxylesterase